MNGQINAETLRKFFEETRIRKYNVKIIIRFLEENIYETFITPNFDIINDYQQFSTDFDNALNDLNSNAKDILIKKYGLIDGVVKTAAEISFSNKLTTDGVGTSVRNSIIYLKSSKKIEELKKYFTLADKTISNDKKMENIKYILDFAKKLENEGDKSD